MYTAFRTYVWTLTNVVSFKYFGRISVATYDNWQAVVVNLQKDRKKWARMYQILVWEGADAHTLVNFFKSVVQAIILFSSEIW